MLELDTARNRQLGIAMVSVTTLCFAALDSTAKWLVLVLPVFQVVWLRFVTHTLLAMVTLTPRYGWSLYRPRLVRLQLLRGLMQAVMTALNFWALQYLQLDVTGAIQFSVPILIAIISARLLDERLDARRWAAILTGFAGVLLIVRPWSQGFHPAVVLSLINAVLYALFNMLTRRMAATELPATTQLWSAGSAALLLTPLGLWQWTPPQDTVTWILVLIMGVFGGLGHLMVTQAHRYASAAVLGPFLYQQIIYMTLFGWLIFGDVPDATVVGGAAVVVASGLYLLYREFRRR
ncbi:MAG: DMT family transporter [Burkholderiaceae bacterium]|nr:DMT family transporter [Rhodoferax sp.]MCB2004305.1 DMT family transporter [Rhodoferax sp.]MCB2031296.1 DMT family transporter [Rhodoferax sp.]MCB2042047.1 DMT family transporter [Rhodoferax sp.]MCP5259731.1 DMT family transporter [Rhodoferax sp.]